MTTTHCGYIALAGRPNVGKSTLLNALIGKKLSITSRKPQTTRHKILGIKTLAEENAQFVFVDTPGIHSPKKASQRHSKLLNQYLNRAAFSALKEVDMIVWIVEAAGFFPEDELILERINKIRDKNPVPFFVVLNKTDLLDNQHDVLPLIETLSQKMPDAEFIPMSAKKPSHIKLLLTILKKQLPEHPFFFDKASVTDRDDAFVAAEMIREKLVRFLGQELPYATMVSIEEMQQKKTPRKEFLHINAFIWVEKEGQKKIVIGEQGKRLKLIGQQARVAMETYFDQQIFLELWVKVKSGWSENEFLLKKVLS